MNYDSNFDTRKVLNRATDGYISPSLIETIESSGATIEQLEALDLPVFKYRHK